MPRYNVHLTDEERQELQLLIQEGEKAYRVKHAQILLKLDKIPENATWTYDCIKAAYGPSHSTIANVAKRYVFEGLEVALGIRKHKSYPRKITDEVEEKIYAIACSEVPEGRTRWTVQALADEAVKRGVVDSITDTSVCKVLKKMRELNTL